MSDIMKAWDVLRDHQRQIDADGVEVGVSRQAVDETLAYIAQLERERDTLQDDMESATANIDSLWSTLIAVGNFLNIDPEQARNETGKPSDVFIAAIKNFHIQPPAVTTTELLALADRAEELDFALADDLRIAAGRTQPPAVTDEQIGEAFEIFEEGLASFGTSPSSYSPQYIFEAGYSAALQEKEQ